jgi:hypothetical protein
VIVVAPAVGTVLVRIGFVGVPSTKGGVSVQLGTKAPNDVTVLVVLGVSKLFTTVQVTVTVPVCPIATFWDEGATFRPITDASASVADNATIAASSKLAGRDSEHIALPIVAPGPSVDRIDNSVLLYGTADYKLGAQFISILRKIW